MDELIKDDVAVKNKIITTLIMPLRDFLRSGIGIIFFEHKYKYNVYNIEEMHIIEFVYIEGVHAL